MSKINKIWFLSIIIFSFWSCNDDDSINRAEFEVLVKIDSLGFESTAQLRERLGGGAQLASIVNRDIEIFKITYKTPYTDGEIVEASGLVLVPSGSSVVNLFSYQHGTLRNKAEAPSNYFQEGVGAEGYFLAPLFASNGYLTVLPDYLGYGASAHLKHPYEHAESTATSCYDFLRAVKEFMDYKNIELGAFTFLGGYSQGGFSTMALTKYIEEHGSADWNITASAPAAGAYNKLAFARNITTIEEAIPYMDVYLWVLDTYNRVYDDLQRPWSYYLKEPYATQASNIVEGPFTALNNTRPLDIFTDEFIAELADDNSAFVRALKANNNYDWRPTVDMRLYHGDADDFVPPFNSINAFDAMQARGATQVELVLFADRNHFTATELYFNDLLLSYFRGFFFQ